MSNPRALFNELMNSGKIKKDEYPEPQKVDDGYMITCESSAGFKSFAGPFTKKREAIDYAIQQMIVTRQLETMKAPAKGPSTFTVKYDFDSEETVIRFNTGSRRIDSTYEGHLENLRKLATIYECEDIINV